MWRKKEHLMFFVFLLQQKSETYPAGTVASLLEDVSLNNLIFTLFLPQAQPNWIEGFRLQSINQFSRFWLWLFSIPFHCSSGWSCCSDGKWNPHSVSSLSQTLTCFISGWANIQLNPSVSTSSPMCLLKRGISTAWCYHHHIWSLGCWDI